MTKEEFEAAARKYREEMFRLYARQPSPPAPMPPDAPPEPRIPTEAPPEPVTVPEDSLWVMGDSRTNSLDSRAHLGDNRQGTIPVDNVRGKVRAVVLPLGRGGIVEHPDILG